MAHPEQRTFCLSVKNKFPQFFTKQAKILDVGSLDINGNNRYLWDDYSMLRYIGIDVGTGRNVNVVCPGHEYTTEEKFDVVISTECFEHDMFWKLTIMNCVHLLRPGGLFLFSCATTGRQEHGTYRTTPMDSPYTCVYYQNLTEYDVRNIRGFDDSFSEFEFSTNNRTKDLYFYGIKNTSNGAIPEI